VKRRQGGILELPMLIGLVIAVVALGSGVLLWKANYDGGKRKEGAAAVRLELQPKLDACETNLATSRGSVTTLQRDLDNAGKAAKAQNDAIAAIDAKAKADAAKSKTEIAAWQRINAGLRGKIASLQAIIDAPKGATPEIACATATSVLREYADEARQEPPK